MKILIVQPGPPAVSETFLQAQADRLPGEVHVAHCDEVTHLDGTPVWNQAAPARLWRKGRRALTRATWNDQERAALARAITRTMPDVVLAQYGPTGVRAMPGCRAAGVPLVVHFHGYDATRHRTLERFESGYREMFQDAAGVIAVSRAMRDQLAAIGCPPHKLHLLPYGTDTSRFGGADPAGAPPRFVAVGRLVEKKTPYITLIAFSRVREQVPEAKLNIVGDGPLRGVCEDLIAALGLGDSVKLLGAQPHEVVRHEMAQARCFVQHSVRAADGDCEGTPVAIIEAGASGLPVVATRHGGIPDVVAHERTGLIVDERDLDGMAEAMLRIAQDSGLAGRMGAAARARIEGEYRLDQSISRLSDMLAGAANTKHCDGRRIDSGEPIAAVAG